MKSILSLSLFVALSLVARADSESSRSAPGLEEFAPALGMPQDTSIAALNTHLEKNWIGATRDEMRVHLNTIIQNRGSLGATKNRKQSFLALSSSTRSLVVNAVYDESGKVVGVKCSVKMREKNPAEPPGMKTRSEKPE